MSPLKRNKRTDADLLAGDEPPIPAGGRRRAPDRREVSLRWLSGTFLTGLTSTVLMGVALFAGVDGKEFLAIPPEVLSQAEVSNVSGGDNSKAGRLAPPTIARAPASTDRRRMSVSTISRVGDADVVRTMPFEHLKIALAAPSKNKTSYPPFNPLAIFAEDDQVAASNADIGSVIYGAEVETEASIRVTDFQIDDTMLTSPLVLSDSEVEEIVRQTAPILTEGSVEIAALHYVDPARFSNTDPAIAGLAFPKAAKIIPQNITVSGQDTDFHPDRSFAEDLVEIRGTAKIAEILVNTEYGKALPMAEAVSTLLRTDSFKAGQVVRLALQGSLMGQNIVRASIYDGREHITTIALNDRNQYVPGQEPLDQGIMALRSNTIDAPKAPTVIARDLPDAYDAIYRGILSYDLPVNIADQIVKMVASDVDFQSIIKPTDRLELFYSVPEETSGSDSLQELLFVEASFSGQSRKFYRYRSDDGSIDYFDQDGKSAKQFLLRNPVPSGKFRSPFGMRRHPILKYAKMHWGVDWSAPRGTPILAPGNGVVEKAGWVGGYGKQTLIRHANGYETSYSHQSSFAKGITPGVRVRQGQVIGYIGTTGLSTGPHLHYEMTVNGKKVDPLRVRLPEGKSLSGSELSAFIIERDRINDLLEKTNDEGQQVAQVAG